MRIIEKIKSFFRGIISLLKVNNKINFLSLIINIIIPVGGGALVGYITRTAVESYRTLNKPSFSPPAIVFPIVWTILYILMGIAAYRIYNKTKDREIKGDEYFFYLVQLLFNFGWSFIFFSFKLYGLAFLWLIILLVLVVITTIKFFKVDKKAGLLMIPYILWLAFAAVLNYYVWMLNEM